MGKDIPYAIKDTKIIYENPWIKLREDTIIRKNGQKGIYSYLVVNESVCVIAVNKSGRICIVETYRQPFKKWFWELPGGGGDGQSVAKAAKRELLEEAGIKASKWTTLGRARVCNGLSTEYQHNILATILEYDDHFVQKEDETRARRFVSLKELDAMISLGEFEDNQSIVALYMYKNWLGALNNS